MMLEKHEYVPSLSLILLEQKGANTPTAYSVIWLCQSANGRSEVGMPMTVCYSP